MPKLAILGRKSMWSRKFASPLAPDFHRQKLLGRKLLRRPDLFLVPVSVEVKREGEISDRWLVTLQRSDSGQALANFYNGGPNPQYLNRTLMYREVLAQAYEYSEPRLGMSRWPTLSETANHLLFNLTEGGGGNQIPTVDAKLATIATVEGTWASRETVIVERMDDGQWRVAGYGRTSEEGLASLDLKVTTSGTIYAIALDDYGVTFVPGLAVAIGDRVRPAAFTGWIYEVTEPGALPAAEPEWWPAIGENPSRPLGTARAVAVRYFRPLAHGPVPVERI
ncbi:hypothetical protein [Phytopseudomonas seleniipraecipitans]|uniref:Uncharacterized protein n=1 Tax=Phytopseudomonas seleniipraecipitans TaxID=640205 RepID=A0A1G7JBJ5_9GAMM|nr:hypothetical protein [Pseudomonas seleniipraecipitans]SDF22275.1 hypothetical protein SAMN05216381_1058 [Pseudomonas seleniipraecipitans]